MAQTLPASPLVTHSHAWARLPHPRRQLVLCKHWAPTTPESPLLPEPESCDQTPPCALKTPDHALPNLADSIARGSSPHPTPVCPVAVRFWGAGVLVGERGVLAEFPNVQEDGRVDG